MFPTHGSHGSQYHRYQHPVTSKSSKKKKILAGHMLLHLFFSVRTVILTLFRRQWQQLLQTAVDLFLSRGIVDSGPKSTATNFGSIDIYISFMVSVYVFGGLSSPRCVRDKSATFSGKGVKLGDFIIIYIYINQPTRAFFACGSSELEGAWDSDRFFRRKPQNKTLWGGHGGKRKGSVEQCHRIRLC